ncbi:ATP-grasp domain-containing protein [Nonomuraea fuscirosea]|uniref:ATP-grasp domain-containing protein n=1 Tax=Nonomuraea fuscirosea TaxID=1291556 RepID=UPI0034151E37
MRTWTAGGSVLLVGGKPDGAVDMLAAYGARMTCVALPKHAKSLIENPHVERVVAVRNPADTEEALLGLRRHGISLDEFDVITSGLEHGLMTAAVMGACSKARVLPLATAALLRDKHAQKTVLRRAGVPTARSAVFVEAHEVTSAAAEVGGLPVVVKPPAGAGAFDTTVLRRAADVAAWEAGHGAGPWLCEEFIPGIELHLDGVVRDGTVTRLSVSRYFAHRVKALEGALGGSVTLREAEDRQGYARARELVQRVVDALGFTAGVYHLEAFEQPNGELVFGECGGRVGGSRIDRAVHLTTGIDLHREWAAAALDAPPPVPADTVPGEATYGWLNLIAGLQGRIISMPSVDAIRNRPGVVDAELKLAVGSSIMESRDTNARVGRAVFRGRDSAEVLSVATALDVWFRANIQIADL